MRASRVKTVVFFFNDTATTEIYTLSLHDALPISKASGISRRGWIRENRAMCDRRAEGRNPFLQCQSYYAGGRQDRKSTRLNSSHANISYAVFCLKKKKVAMAKPFSIQSVTSEHAI